MISSDRLLIPDQHNLLTLLAPRAYWSYFLGHSDRFCLALPDREF